MNHCMNWAHILHIIQAWSCDQKIPTKSKQFWLLIESIIQKQNIQFLAQYLLVMDTHWMSNLFDSGWFANLFCDFTQCSFHEIVPKKKSPHEWPIGTIEKKPYLLTEETCSTQKVTLNSPFAFEKRKEEDFIKTWNDWILFSFRFWFF